MANAAALLDEAELLYKHGRLGRAAALAVFSVEEFGKAQLCHVWAFHREPGPDEQAWQPFWDAFVTHPDKVDMLVSLVDGLVKCGERAAWRHGATTTHLSKLARLYVDWLPDRHLLTTPENVTQEEATQFMEMARQALAYWQARGWAKD
jgi:AbiV family abortive infection protein